MYLHLYHGRTDLNQEMDDWGTDGPTFECSDVVITYATSIRIFGSHNDGELRIVDDCVFYDGVYYGDWSVFDSTSSVQPTNLQPFKQELGEVPTTAATNPLFRAAPMMLETLKRIHRAINWSTPYERMSAEEQSGLIERTIEQAGGQCMLMSLAELRIKAEAYEWSDNAFQQLKEAVERLEYVLSTSAHLSETAQGALDDVRYTLDDFEPRQQ